MTDLEQAQAAIASAISQLQDAQMLLNRSYGVAGGGGGGSYTAQAITIPGHSGNGVQIDAPVGVANDSKVTISTVFKFTADGLSNFLVIFGGSSGAVQITPGNNFTTDIGLNIAGPNGEYFSVGSADGALTAEQWYHAFVSADMGHEDGAKVCSLWLNGADVLDPDNTSDGNASFDIAFMGTGAAPAFTIPDAAGEPYDQDYSDTQIWIGQAIDPAVHIGKFWSGGKPVDPAVAAAQFGAPTFLLSGDKDTFAGSLEVNRGPLFATGSNGPGPISGSPATVGQAVRRVLNFSSEDVTSEFEATISVTDELQQTSATDYSAESLSITLVETLLDAVTSPSD